MVTFKEVWNKFTVSSILIFPILRDDFYDLIHPKNLPVPLLQFFLENGLVNVFLGEKDNHPGEGLFLLFKKGPVQKLVENIITQYYSVNEMILDWELFRSIFFISDDYIVYHISIPEKWKNDVDLITNSKYSHVSDAYKQALYTRSKVRIPKSKDRLISFVSKKNIAVKVTRQDPEFKILLEEFLGSKIPPGTELYKKFRTEQETLNLTRI